MPTNLPVESYRLMPRFFISCAACFDGEVSAVSMPRRLVPACSPRMPCEASSAMTPVVSSIEMPIW
jgi:hypothetical protein